MKAMNKKFYVKDAKQIYDDLEFQLKEENNRQIEDLDETEEYNQIDNWDQSDTITSARMMINDANLNDRKDKGKNKRLKNSDMLM